MLISRSSPHFHDSTHGEKDYTSKESLSVVFEEVQLCAILQQRWKQNFQLLSYKNMSPGVHSEKQLVNNKKSAIK